MELLWATLPILLALLLNEWWWHGRRHGEASRKLIHISVGTFVAFWPLFLSWQQIELLSLAFVGAVLISRQFHVFKAIHSVQRPTWGELYFGIAVGLVAMLTHEPAIYVAALLHMSLADGLAAIVGHRYGHRYVYRIFGSSKSRLGTATFLAVSLIILAIFDLQQQAGLGVWLPLIAIAATALENAAVRGLDNLLVPLAVTVLLGIAG